MHADSDRKGQEPEASGIIGTRHALRLPVTGEPAS
jgi:hypothetical protein